MGSAKTQRVRDYVHDLIIFQEKNKIDQLAWKLLNSREFQRLRRIRQLGFSEFVFPGATHTRFSHSIGVFHVARRLLGVIERELGNKKDDKRCHAAAIAALLHDIGHGPFSHVFERVDKRRGVIKAHEHWGAEIIRGDTELHAILEKEDSSLPNAVARIISQDVPEDIYSAVVSSQFDADRLDYLLRDRYMTGTGTGQFDFEWLLDCLVIGKIWLAHGTDQDAEEVDTLCLNNKGLNAAEEYLVARFHLYSQVYLHKTTRAAENMLRVLLQTVSQLRMEGNLKSTNLPAKQPLSKYLRTQNPNLNDYLRLDESQIWSAIHEMKNAKDETISTMANGLIDRKLLKCVDIGSRTHSKVSDAEPRFRDKLREYCESQNLSLDRDIIEDRAPLSAYKYYEHEGQGSLGKVMIQEPDRKDRYEDIAKRSRIVEAIGEDRIYRVYVPDNHVAEVIKGLWDEVA